MPHLRIEYSANLAHAPAWPALFAELHAMLHRVASIEPANCKSRAYAADAFLVGEPGRSPAEAFVHLELRIFEGRTAELVEAIGSEALACLERACRDASPAQPLQITVAIDELPRARYFKSSPA